MNLRRGSRPYRLEEIIVRFSPEGLDCPGEPRVRGSACAPVSAPNDPTAGSEALTEPGAKCSADFYPARLGAVAP